jgi:hypothetical protein
MQLFCPTEQRFRRANRLLRKSLISLPPATVHGVVFDVLRVGALQRGQIRAALTFAWEKIALPLPLRLKE